MAPARSLHEIFAGLSGDAAALDEAAAVLDANGYADLPAELLAQAVVSYAETAPVEVAEHLAPFVMAHSQVVGEGAVPDDLAAPLDLLASAPAAPVDAAELDDLPEIDALAEPGADLDAPDSVDGGDSVTGPGEIVAGPADGSAGGLTVDGAFGHGEGAPVDRLDPAQDMLDAIEPESGAAGPAGYDSQLDGSDLPTDALLSDDPWAVPPVAAGTPEIDDIDEG
ncbi:MULTISPECIES: hypothetical protein [unclassified Solwaraspora]|uniref:hypothetical protein n=1 Tax=unclassified Solwaraspora TaxID=2627926 RepID=UPI00259B9C98|nr:hypothetical protein [Solwaraspora sp. WMMA2056]WJK41030.1 hypothetical protein O7608_00780 [Solwaraspora sp. WMMA2056]